MDRSTSRCCSTRSSPSRSSRSQSSQPPEVPRERPAIVAAPRLGCCAATCCAPIARRSSSRAPRRWSRSLVSIGIAYVGEVGRSELFYRIFFVAALFAWGTIATSSCFSDMHGRATNTAFLLLPASALEKTVSRLLIYTVGLDRLLARVHDGACRGCSRASTRCGSASGASSSRRSTRSPGCCCRTSSWRRRCSSSAPRGSARCSSSRRSAPPSASCSGLGAIVAIARLDGLGPTRRASTPIATSSPLFEWLIDAAPVAYFYAAAAVLLVRRVVARDRDAGEPWSLANRRGSTSRSPTRCAIASWPASGTKASASRRCASSRWESESTQIP